VLYYMCIGKVSICQLLLWSAHISTEYLVRITDALLVVWGADCMWPNAVRLNTLEDEETRNNSLLGDALELEGRAWPSAGTCLAQPDSCITCYYYSLHVITEYNKKDFHV